jgi:hypothetical protein
MTDSLSRDFYPTLLPDDRGDDESFGSGSWIYWITHGPPHPGHYRRRAANRRMTGILGGF